MFKSILMPTDGSPLSDKAIAAAIRFAGLNGSRIVALSVYEAPAPVFEGGHIDGPYTRKYSDRMSLIAESMHPCDEIVRAAHKYDCDVIFMASHGRKGLNKLLLGGETQKVLANSDIPVLVFR